MKEKHRRKWGKNGVGQLTTVGKKKEDKENTKGIIEGVQGLSGEAVLQQRNQKQEAQTRERTLMEGERRHALVDATRTDNMKKQNREETNVK